MAKSYSSDLRRRIIRFVEKGGSRREAARRFEVSPSFAVKLVAQWRRTGSAAAGKRGRKRPGRLAAHHDFLIAEVEARPDITMPELAAVLRKARRVSAEMVLDTLERLDRAVAMYERMGFVRIPAYYQNPEADVVYMRLAL